ncbi:unnamed protein product [Rotaria sp. Silwood1]|nr:unnamed protein product [Rotaria sp. Silwood1]
MLFSGVYHSSSEEVLSDGETTSSITSDATSRTTTSDTWYDVKSDFEQQPITQFDHTTEANIRMKTFDDHDEDLIRSINDIYIDGGTTEDIDNMRATENNLHDIPNQHNQKQDTPKEWVNPYWGIHRLPTTKVTGPRIQGNIESSKTHRASSNTTIQQLIPGSILINDRDEIEDPLWKQRNSSVESLTSSNSFHPGGQYISDERGGRGGFLAPTHVQHHTAAIPSDLPENSTDNFTYKQYNSSSDDSSRMQSPLNHEQTSSEPDIYENKQWENSYWLASNELDTELTTDTTTSSTPSLISGLQQKETLFPKEESISLLQNTDSEPLSSSIEIPWPHTNWETKLIGHPTSATDETQSTTSSTGSWKHNESHTPTFENQQDETSRHSATEDSASDDFMSPEQNNSSSEHLSSDDEKSNTSAPARQEDLSKDNPNSRHNTSEATISSKQSDTPTATVDWNHYQSHATTSSKHQDTPWVNPYWKDYKPHIITSSKAQDKPWVNPYWKDYKSHSATPSNQQDKPWVNPYWKDQKSPTVIPSKQQQKPWVNPYWKDYTHHIPSMSKQRDKPWINPYWTDYQSRPVTTSKQQDKLWVNPYWKDYKPHTTTTSQQQEKPWVNPYWKDYKPRTTMPSKQQEKPWVNPYWKDYKTHTATTPKQQAKPWINPYWKDYKSRAVRPPKQQDKPWVNPYWKDYKPRTVTPSTQQDKPWVNPYWKDYKPRTVTPPKQQDKPWVNPYWKDYKPRTVTPSKQQDKPWINPYWKDYKPRTVTPSKQQDKPWVNPYWKDYKPRTVTPSKQQDKPWVNPYWKDYKPRTVTPSKQHDKSWVNPYWKDYKPRAVTPLKQQDKAWVNPYWKDYKPRTVTPSKQQDKAWVNPYWKDYKPRTVTPSKQQDKAWVNPYWKDYKPHTATISKQQDKPWINPYWKDYKSRSVTASKQQEKPWVDPIRKDYKPHTVTGSKVQDKPWVNSLCSDNKTPMSTLSKTQDILWVNPYWKDWKPGGLNRSQQYQNVPFASGKWQTSASQTSTTTKERSLEGAKQQDKPWVNPYWKDYKPDTMKPWKPQDKPWVNPYWNDNKTLRSITLQKQGIPWQNPYWKDWKPGSFSTSQQYRNVRFKSPNRHSGASPSSETGEQRDFKEAKLKDKPWVNPYWDNNKTSTSTLSKKQDIPWQNPYWKDWKPGYFNRSEEYQHLGSKNPQSQNDRPQTAGTTKVESFGKTKEKDKAWENPYWKHEHISSTVPRWASSASKRSKYGIELTNAWITDNVSPPDHRVPPIPSFYKRIYPVNIPPASIPLSTTINKNKSQPDKEPMHLGSSSIPDEIYNNGVKNDDDFSPYTIDRQGIAHYQSQPSSSFMTENKTVQFATSPSTTENRMSSTYSTNTIPVQEKHTMAPKSSMSNVTTQYLAIKTTPSSTTNSRLLEPLNSLHASSYSPTNYPSSTHSRVPLITLDELHDIQHALRLLEINPNAIPTIETSQQHIATVYANDEKAPHLPVRSLFTNNANKQSIQQPSSSSSYPRNEQSTFLSNTKSQQSPIASSSKNSSNPNDIFNRFIQPGSFNHI